VLKRPQGSFHSIIIDAEMSHQPKPACRIDLDAALQQAVLQLQWLQRTAIHIDHVGLYRLDNQTECTQTIGKPVRPRMIFGKPMHIVTERMQPGSCKHPRLPHPPTQNLAPAPRSRNQRRIANQDGTGRSPKPFGETNGNSIEHVNQVLQRQATSDRRIENAGTIQMQAQTVRLREGPQGLKIGDWQHLALHRVLETQKPGTREMEVQWLDYTGHSIQIQ